MVQADKAAFAVEGPSPPQQELQHTHRTGQHKKVPRWLRMSLRTGILVGLIALPTLAVKEESFTRLHQYKGFSILFAALGAFVVPMWIPLLGDVVLAFTAIIPIGLAGIWLAYGLYQAFSNIIFMMLLCAVIGGGVFFLSELLSLPVGLLSVFPTLFIVGANQYVQQPAMAWMITAMVTALLFIAAVVASAVCAVVFPEYCVDEVFRHHHEALEHLLHLAYYAMGLKPPALVQRVYSSAAAGIGSTGKWKDAFRAADELPSNLQAFAEGLPAALENSMTSRAGSEVAGGPGSVQQAVGWNLASVKTERSWHRVSVACQAGAKAQVGAMAEVVLMAAHHKRMIIPCSPLLPCAKGQIDTAGLLALRHLALSTALHIIKIYNATQPLDEATSQLLQQLLSADEWSAMRSSLLASLQELTDTFPMDYYPAGAPPNRQHLLALQSAVAALQDAWKETTPAKSKPQKQQELQQQQQQQEPQHEGGQAEELRSGHAAVTVAPDTGAGAEAAADAFKDPLVVEGSPAAMVLARMNTVHLIKLLQDLVLLLEQLYEVVAQVSGHMITYRCC